MLKCAMNSDVLLHVENAKPSQKCKNIQYIIDIKVAVLVETFKNGRDLSVPEQHKNTDTMNKTD